MLRYDLQIFFFVYLINLNTNFILKTYLIVFTVFRDFFNVSFGDALQNSVII